MRIKIKRILWSTVDHELYTGVYTSRPIHVSIDMECRALLNFIEVFY